MTRTNVVPKKTMYKLAPVTASTADFLAKTYGYLNIEDFVKSLPQSARVLDIGAGESELGLIVTGLRKDIIWTNMDINYTPTDLNKLSSQAPNNLQYIYGDILDSKTLPSSEYDLIYSFWVLPHIGLENPTLISQAIVNMLALLKNNNQGRLIIGPLMSKRDGSIANNYQISTLNKNAGEKDIMELAEKCTVQKKHVALYRGMNKAGVTTLRNSQRTGKKPTKKGLWDYRSRQYVKVLSVKGLILATRLKVYHAIEAIRSTRTNKP